MPAEQMMPTNAPQTAPPDPNSGRAQSLDDLRGTFGDETPGDAARQAEVTALFDRIAPRYDLMNDLMSFGTHRLWKAVVVRAMVARLAGRAGPHLDLAGGTGDLGRALAALDPARVVIIADASEGMLEIARQRGGARLDYLHTRAEALPLATGSVAGITMAFGLRNMGDPAAALRECARVLAPGATLALLEFSQPAAWFAPFYALHARWVIPSLGALVAGDRRAYRYLVQSIRRFPGSAVIAQELAAAGLRLEAERAFMFGIARLHLAVKP